jgi:GNAT superfamily N-acetyltransferase
MDRDCYTIRRRQPSRRVTLTVAASATNACIWAMLTIRAAVEAEADIVASLIRCSFATQVEMLGIRENEYPNYVGFETASSVRRRMAAGIHVALACLDEESIGTISCSPDAQDPRAGDIMRLGVAPSGRGRGYGRLLMGYAEAQLTMRGVSVARLAIVARFERLREYYEQQGYAGIEVKHAPSLPFRLIVMEKGSGARPVTPDHRGHGFFGNADAA